MKQLIRTTACNITATSGWEEKKGVDSDNSYSANSSFTVLLNLGVFSGTDGSLYESV